MRSTAGRRCPPPTPQPAPRQSQAPRRPAHRFSISGTSARPNCSEVTVRISHQTRAWFKGPWRLGERAWSATFLVLGGSRRGDGDVGFGVEGAELVQEAAGTAGGAGHVV